MNKLQLLNPTKLNNKQLFVTTSTVFCVAKVTNHTPLRSTVQWIFFILMIIAIVRLFQTKAGKKISDAFLFAAFMQNFRGR